MTVTELGRNELFRWFVDKMSKEQAATMMSLLPPVGWTDMATKRDLDNAVERLDSKIDSSIARLDSKIDSLTARLDTSVDRLDARIDGVETRIDHLSQLMDARFDALPTTKSFVSWMIGFNASMITAFGILLAVFG